VIIWIEQMYISHCFYMYSWTKCESYTLAHRVAEPLISSELPADAEPRVDISSDPVAEPLTPATSTEPVTEIPHGRQESLRNVRGLHQEADGSIGWHDRSWTILNGKLNMLKLSNDY